MHAKCTKCACTTNVGSLRVAHQARKVCAYIKRAKCTRTKEAYKVRVHTKRTECACASSAPSSRVHIKRTNMRVHNKHRICTWGIERTKCARCTSSTQGACVDVKRVKCARAYHVYEVCAWKSSAQRMRVHIKRTRVPSARSVRTRIKRTGCDRVRQAPEACARTSSVQSVRVHTKCATCGRTHQVRKMRVHQVH